MASGENVARPSRGRNSDGGPFQLFFKFENTIFSIGFRPGVYRTNAAEDGDARVTRRNVRPSRPFSPDGRARVTQTAGDD